MGFDKLEQHLKNFFETESSRSNQNINIVEIKEHVFQEFLSRKKTSPFTILFRSNWIRSAAFGAVILSLVPVVGGDRSAGELQPSGLVEIVRNGEVFIASAKTPLKIGDQILVGNNASAEIQMRKAIKTTAGNHTELRITKQNSLFLVKGDLDGEFEEHGSITTDRGQISGKEATLKIAVSETGETYIQPKNNDIYVTTWDNEKTTLVAGEELRLHTDATLPRELPQNLNLSSSQLLAIQAKLLIARTKALNALEQRINQDEKKFTSELISADRSFRSVVQVLKSSRNLEIVRRENLDLVSREEVIQRIEARANNEKLVAETRAVSTLLEIIENIQVPQFTILESNLRIFNRYVLLQRLFAPLSTNIRFYGNILQEQYIEAAAKQITEAKSPAVEIEKILTNVPNSSAGRLFLQRITFYLTPSLQTYLEDHWKELQ